MKRMPKILVVDDDAMIHRLIEVRLKALEVEVIAALSGPAGLAAARQHRPDLILLDVAMPEMDGFEVCRRLRDHAVTHEIPVIFLTGSDRSEEKSRGFEVGAVDYVTKPFDASELKARVRSALRAQALVEALEMQARTDALTGLPNRAALHKRLAQCIDRVREREDCHFAVLFIDLDRFKVINDSLGHGIGDQLLIGVADMLCRQSCKLVEEGVVGVPPFVARMGGDEFTVLIETSDRTTAAAVGERLCASLQAPLQLSGHHVVVGASIGVRFCDSGLDDADTLLRDSDTAMYRAKADGKGRCVLFDQHMLADAHHRLQLEQDLYHALEAHQLAVDYQPIVDLESRQIQSVEALMRWRHPEFGFISPEQFIPIAEETGLIREMGRWVLRRACRQFSEWSKRGLVTPEMTISVNVSKVQLKDRHFPEMALGVVAECGLSPSRVQLEVTESTIMHDMQVVVPMLDRLHEMGFVLAMDDFGKGYSSLSSLHRFPIHQLKVDREFVDVMTQSRAHSAVMHAIITLADNMSVSVVAEGIETEEHLVLLQALDCTYGQGYLFSRPQSPEKLETVLKKWSLAAASEGVASRPDALPARSA